MVIRFKASLDKPVAAGADSEALVTLPADASAELPSRGMVMVEGSLNGLRFRALLQPDGYGRHWFKVSRAMCQAAGAGIGGSVSLEIEPVKEWPEPQVPAQVRKALAADPAARAQWEDITPMARWDWLNWMDSVKLSKTRQERPEKLVSMLKAGKRRPCCFNRAALMAPKTAEPL